jgi:hypothetical protein
MHKLAERLRVEHFDSEHNETEVDYYNETEKMLHWREKSNDLSVRFGNTLYSYLQINNEQR